MIADFVAPIAPAGWLECDGSVVSTATYSGLFAVMSVTSSGTRTNGNAIITSIPSTTNFKAGYYVFGTGISAGTTILTVDSPTQITMSGVAGSSGTSAFFVSPWAMNTGTVTLPDLTINGKFRRSRSSSTSVGQVQSDQNKAHTHSLSVAGTTSSDGAHTHTVNITDPGHFHGGERLYDGTSGGTTDLTVSGGSHVQNNKTGVSTTSITAATVSNGAHTHTVTSTGTSGSDGGTETRPTNMIFLTCVKT